MDVTGWKAPTLGVRVGASNRAKYFSKDWEFVEVELDGVFHSITVSPGFWRKCPELRGSAIQTWLVKHGHAPWPKGKPPKLELIRLGGNRFRLLATQS